MIQHEQQAGQFTSSSGLRKVTGPPGSPFAIIVVDQVRITERTKGGEINGKLHMSCSFPFLLLMMFCPYDTSLSDLLLIIGCRKTMVLFLHTPLDLLPVMGWLSLLLPTFGHRRSLAEVLKWVELSWREYYMVSVVQTRSLFYRKGSFPYMSLIM